MNLFSRADKNYLVLLACCTLISIGLQWGGEALQIALRYSRPDILEGQWWRLFTGHFLHVGWMHLGMNLAAALLLVFFLDRSRSMLYWLLVWITCLFGAGFGLFFFSPQVLWYVGLSGALH